MDALNRNRLMTQGLIINVNKDTLHPMYMTATFCAITVAPAVFRVSGQFCSQKITELVDTFSSLVSMVHCRRNVCTDGPLDEALLEDGGYEYFLSKILEKGKSYVSSVHSL